MTVRNSSPSGTLATAANVSGSAVCVDGHVHYYRRFDPLRFLDAAIRNVRDVDPGTAELRRDRAVLLLAEPADADPFELLRAGLRSAPSDGWTLHPTGERDSRVAHRADGSHVALVAGRQVVTGENVEVLALATSDPIPTGRPLPETIRLIRSTGGLPVLPWGFGKWWFRRGRLLARLFHREDGPEVFVADSAGRPQHLPEPRLLRRARKAGPIVLAGTDPLPLPGHAERPARFGFLLESFPIDRAPARQIRRRLRSLDASPPIYGRTDSVLEILMSQVRLRLGSGTLDRDGT